MTARAGPRRQRVVAARLRAVTPGAWSRSPARRSPRALGAPARRGRLHRRRHRGRQPRGQGPLLGPPRRGPAPARASSAPRSSTTPCSTRCDWLGEHEGAEVELVPVDRLGRARPRRLPDGRRVRPRERRPGHRHVGQQRGRHGPAGRRARRDRPRARRSRSTPTRCRRSASCRSTSRASGLDAMTVTGHKLGGPSASARSLVAGELQPTAAAARRRPGARRPLRHPRHRRRSPASPRPVELAVERAAGAAPERLAALRDDLVDRRATCGARTPFSTATRDRPEHRLPGNAHFSFPGCEGDALLLLLDARGIECSTGSACSAGVPQPSHVLLAMGCLGGGGAVSLRFSLGHTSTAGRRRRAGRGDRPGRRARPQRGPRRRGCRARQDGNP